LPQSTYSDVAQETVSGKLDAAFQEASRAYSKYDRKDPYWAWRFRILKAHILFMRGSNKDALLLLRDDPPPALSNTDVAIRRKLVQGLAYQGLQDYENAKKNLDASINLCGPDQASLLGTALVARGTLEIDISNYAEAEVDFHRALATARQNKIPTLEATALGNLGFVAMKEGHYDESIDWDREALQFSRSTGQQVSMPPILGNIGWSYFEMGDFDNALDFYKQAENAASQSGIAGSVGWLSNIGSVYYAQHNLASAKATILQALELSKKLENSSTTIECLDELSQIALDGGQIGEAEQFNKDALEAEKIGHDIFDAPYTMVASGRIAGANLDFARGESLFQKIIDNPKIEQSLRWEAEARLAKTYSDAGAPEKAEVEYRLAIDTIETARSTVKSEDFRLSFLSSAISFYSDYIDFLVSHGRAQDALEVAELSRTHALVDTTGESSPKLLFPIKGFHPSQIAARLNSVLFSYWLGPHKSYLWAATRNRVAIYELPPAGEIDQLVRAYRRDLEGSRDVLASENANGRKLYDLLVAPAKALVSKGARVTILPDGSLYDLNFESLLAPSPKLHFWIDDVIVANANSLLLLAASTTQKLKQSGNLLLIGNPVSPSADFPDLPQASAEMSQIEKYFPPARREVLTKQQATPGAYLNSRPGQFSFIHFVAHGTSSRTSPLDSAVILSRQGDAYKLYARDVMKLRLSADLVTISACHGAGGRTYSGEGLVGLTWAFLRAGAHGVIAALWEVNDTWTSEMMKNLYGEMSKGTPPDIALRDSKLAFIHSTNIYRKPFYWAAFQIYRGS
jgi:CHAT domain-containing protein/Tfp pilus assembly protein PilF